MFKKIDKKQISVSFLVQNHCSDWRHMKKARFTWLFMFPPCLKFWWGVG